MGLSSEEQVRWRANTNVAVTKSFQIVIIPRILAYCILLSVGALHEPRHSKQCAQVCCVGILHRMGPLNCGPRSCGGRSVTLLLGQAVRASRPPPPSPEPCYKQRRHISQAYQQLPSAARYPSPKDKQVLTRIGYYCTPCVTRVGRGHVRKTGAGGIPRSYKSCTLSKESTFLKNFSFAQLSCCILALPLDHRDFQ